MFVRDWMTPQVVTTSPGTKLGTALGLMNERKVRRLPVVDGGKLTGILTKSDVYAALGPLTQWPKNLFEERTVDEAMTRNPVTVFPGDTIEHAAVVMLDRRVSGLPVVDKKGLEGIVTETDIFRALVEIMGLRERGARVSMRLEAHGKSLLPQLEKKFGKMQLRSLVAYHDKKQDDWIAIARVRGRE